MKTKVLFLLVFSLALTFLNCWTLEVDEPPCMKITGFSPSGAAAGETVTIQGINFCEGRPDLHTILIGETPVPLENIEAVPSAQTIRFRVPEGIGNGQISVALRTAPLCGAAKSTDPFYYYYTAGLVSKVVGNPPPATCTGDLCLKSPKGIDLDRDGNIWVADYGNHVVRQYKNTGSFIRRTGRFGTNGGCSNDFFPDGSVAPFFNPIDVAADSSDGAFVAEQNNTLLRYISASGSVSRVAGKCFDDGFLQDGDCIGSGANTAKLSVPTALARDGSELYFIDQGNVRKVEGNCIVRTIAAKNGEVQNAKTIRVSRALATRGPVIIADADGNAKLKSISMSGVVSNIPVSANNLLIDPVALAVDSKGAIFVADQSSHKIYAVYPDGQIVLFAGSQQGYSGDGVSTGLDAQFNAPAGLALDESLGFLYVSDSNNNVIRKIEVK
ncbi:MAG: IPT/TIG domain-containing protein [Saprospiraceae bacterium]|nr:IPT/TIG domain-containing protein [Lewinellaceae bacterium]